MKLNPLGYCGYAGIDYAGAELIKSKAFGFYTGCSWAEGY